MADAPRRDLTPDPSQPAGLPGEERSGMLAAAIGLGGFWGLVTYTILWEGEPVQVNRPFVQSVVGTLVLLPVRIVIWGIRLAERLAGHAFDLSDNNLWIAFVASALGAAIGFGVLIVVRLVRRRSMHGRAAIVARHDDRR